MGGSIRTKHCESCNQMHGTWTHRACKIPACRYLNFVFTFYFYLFFYFQHWNIISPILAQVYQILSRLFPPSCCPISKPSQSVPPNYCVTISDDRMSPFAIIMIRDIRMWLCGFWNTFILLMIYTKLDSKILRIYLSSERLYNNFGINLLRR